MLSGFNRWQRRVALLGFLGVLVGALGFVGPWPAAVVVGFSVAIITILVLILLGNRQNWRHFRRLRVQLAQLTPTPNSNKPKELSTDTELVPRIDANYFYAQRVLERVTPFETFAMRNKSLKIRDAFSHAVTQGQLDYQGLLNTISLHLLEIVPSDKRLDVSKWNHQSFRALARLQANQRICESDLENAVRMFEFAEIYFGRKVLGHKDRLLYVEALGELHRYEDQALLLERFNIARQFPVHAQLVGLNAIHAMEGPASEWINALNAIYIEHGFSPVVLDPVTDAQPLDRLSTRSPEVSGEPLVSIIVPTYQGGRLLLSALGSLLNQSWKNLEIIVVDDGSGPEFEDYLSRASKLSSKIRVIRQDQNLGAYSARNAGIKHARGEFITVHDDDDWSHGDKIATQVQYMIDNPDASGVMSSHVRVSEDLKFLRINVNPTFLQTNFSSLMVRRSTFEAVGLWDDVNRGADSEFRDRVVKYLGKQVKVLDTVPLSFTRIWKGSLTSGELSRGFMDPARTLYAKAYKQWHKTAGSDLSLLRPQVPRNYPVPSTMQPGCRNADIGQFDVVFMADFRSDNEALSKTFADIEAASSEGYRVGYIHIDSPLNGSGDPVQDRIFKLQLDGTVEQVGILDSAKVERLIVRHPSAVHFMDGASTKLQVNRTLLHVEESPVSLDGEGMKFELGDCLRILDRLFGNYSRVMTDSDGLRTQCRYFTSEQRFLDRSWSNIQNYMDRFTCKAEI